MRQLLSVAAEFGVTVHAAHLPGDLLGCYLPDASRIYFDLRLTPAERRSVVAHELGHARYGHACDNPKHERQADAFAARLLIDPTRYELLEHISDDRTYLAEEFNVTTEIIDAYRTHCLVRIGTTTYARARMGAGQWHHRAGVA